LKKEHKEEQVLPGSMTAEEKWGTITEKPSIGVPVLLTMLIMLVVMIALQAAKHYYFPDIANWQYHAHTNIVSALVAALVAFFILRNRQTLLYQIARNVDELRLKEEELEKHRRHLEDLVEERTAELKAANEQLRQQIRHREQVETALRESEASFRALAETSPAGIFIVQDTYFRYSNGAMNAITGYSGEELASMHFWDNIHPEFRENIKERGFARLRGEPAPDCYELKIVNKGGDERWLEAAVILINYKDKPAALGTVMDITRRKEAEAILKESEERYRAAIEYSNDGVALVKEGSYIFVNRKFVEMFGYDNPGEIEGAPLSIVIHPDGRESVMEINRKMQEGETAQQRYEFRGIRRDGGIIDVEVSANQILYHGETVALAYLRDITARKQWEESLHESEEKYRSLFEESRDAIYITTKDGKWLDGNEAFLELFGRTREEIRGMNARDVYASSQEREKFRKAIKDKGSVRDFDIRLRRKDGTVMDCLLTVSAKRDDGGKVMAYQGIVRDITDRRKAEEAVRHMAYHDLLTGLPNRLLFSDRLMMAMIRAKRNEQRVAVVMLDLDKFKDINDTLGHSMGDELLKTAAVRLKRLLRKSDTIARMGGDEFLLILPDINQVEDAHRLVRKIMTAFHTPFLVEGYEISITTSAGISVYPDDGPDTNTLIKKADIAMYKAKQSGRNIYQRYVAPEESGTQARPTDGP
jgi:diguanylate cyclase (GGDEF)-like protein/PAS domain S-box-containing protein